MKNNYKYTLDKLVDNFCLLVTIENGFRHRVFKEFVDVEYKYKIPGLVTNSYMSDRSYKEYVLYYGRNFPKQLYSNYLLETNGMDSNLEMLPTTYLALINPTLLLALIDYEIGIKDLINDKPIVMGCGDGITLTVKAIKL